MDTKSVFSLRSQADELHLAYMQELINGTLSPDDLYLVQNPQDIKYLHKTYPKLKLCQPLSLLEASVYLLSNAEDLQNLEKIIATWEKPKLYNLSMDAETYIYAYLSKKSKEDERYRKAALQVRTSILKKNDPVSVHSLSLLSNSPEIVLLKLRYLIENEDYSPYLTEIMRGLNKHPNENQKKVCRYLMENGYIKQIRPVIDYLSELTTEELGFPEEIGLHYCISKMVQEKSHIDSSDYKMLMRSVNKLSTEAQLKILLTLCNRNLVCSHRNYMPHTSGSSLTLHPDTDLILEDLLRLVKSEQNASINLAIARGLKFMPPLRQNQKFQELSNGLLTSLPEKDEEVLEILDFIKTHYEEDYRLPTSEFFRQCLKQVSEQLRTRDNLVEIVEFKHWAIKKGELYKSNSFLLHDDVAFIVFYTDSPNSLDWKKGLPFLLNNTSLSTSVVKEAIRIISQRHSTESIEFLSPKELEQLSKYHDVISRTWQDDLK